MATIRFYVLSVRLAMVPVNSIVRRLDSAVWLPRSMMRYPRPSSRPCPIPRIRLRFQRGKFHTIPMNARCIRGACLFSTPAASPIVLRSGSISANGSTVRRIRLVLSVDPSRGWPHSFPIDGGTGHQQSRKSINPVFLKRLHGFLP